MTSPRRRQDRPIESVSLRVTFRGGKEEADRIKMAVPSASLRRGAVEFRVDTEEPAEMAERTRAILKELKAGR